VVRTIAREADLAQATIVIVTARDEADTVGATLDALHDAFPGAPVVLADDGSRDGTPAIARAHGARVVGDGRRRGKGGAATVAARVGLELAGESAIYVLCDADLGVSARLLVELRDAVADGRADLAVAAFEHRIGGGFGVARGFARWMLARRCGVELSAPISGQRALTGASLAALLPFAPRFGMEVAMTIDALRRGDRLVEVPIDLAHRATGRSLAGFVHRARQLTDFAEVYVRRRSPKRG
jgi:glycosyltransferase involved in cell wall biosynthesis